MYVCRNCSKVIEHLSSDLDDFPEQTCPWCQKDPRYGPVARVVRTVWFGFSLLAIVVIIALIVLKPSG